MPRLTTLVLGFITALLCGSLFASTDSQRAMQSLNQMPLAFTENVGQWDDRVLFRANAGGATMWFTREGVTYQFTRRIDSGNLDDRRGDPCVFCIKTFFTLCIRTSFTLV
jgi:hypothetical protein